MRSSHPALRVLAAPLAAVALLWAAPAIALDLGLGLGGAGVGISVGTPETPAPPQIGVRPGDGALLPSAGTEVEIVLGPDAALEAVTSRRALPLSEIIALARAETSGELLDARLISLKGFLLYELKILAANGDIADLYFYAQSGNRVKTP